MARRAGGEGGLVGEGWLRTGIGRSAPDAMTVPGRDLAHRRPDALAGRDPAVPDG